MANGKTLLLIALVSSCLVSMALGGIQDGPPEGCKSWWKVEKGNTW